MNNFRITVKKFSTAFIKKMETIQLESRLNNRIGKFHILSFDSTISKNNAFDIKERIIP